MTTRRVNRDERVYIPELRIWGTVTGMEGQNAGRVQVQHDNGSKGIYHWSDLEVEISSARTRAV